jgi:mannosyltransferase OCH1-like enzyme
VSWPSLPSGDTMLGSRGGNGSRNWLAAIACFCIFYWILKAERHALSPASTWKSNVYNELPPSSAHANYGFAEDGHDATSPAEHSGFQAITKAHPQPTTSPSEEFPKLIWQTSNAEGVERWANESATWTEKNREWEYNLLSGQLAHNVSPTAGDRF